MNTTINAVISGTTLTFYMKTNRPKLFRPNDPQCEAQFGASDRQ